MSWSSRRHRAERLGAVGSQPRTLVDKIWDAHRIGPAEPPAGAGERVSVDRVLLHEHQVGLLGRSASGGCRVADPRRVVACADQQVPTAPGGDGPRPGAQLAAAIERLEAASTELGLPLFGPGDPRGGVVNVVAAEQGMVLPGQLVVGADAHVSTLGALGALALVASDDEVGEVLAATRIVRARPGVLRIAVSGDLGPNATPKDLALWLLGRVRPGAAAGCVLELDGPVVRALSIEGRMTVSNVLVETGAVAVVVAPDDATLDYLHGRPFAPSGRSWIDASLRWRRLVSDPGAERAGDLILLGRHIRPHVSWGTAPWQVAPLDGVVPAPDSHDAARFARDELALHEQALRPGTPFTDVPVDQVFIGSCANARIEDLRAAAAVVRGGRSQVPAWVVPGSWPVKRQAETEGLHRVFRDAGFEWRDPGCSLCIGANGDSVAPGARLASTANRAPRGHVGPAARIHLVSPAAAGATALAGRLHPPPA